MTRPASKSIMSAAEAADRLAQRYHSRQLHELSGGAEEGSPIYTCKNCGANEFNVEHTFLQARTFTHTVMCTCDEREGEEAGHRTVTEYCRCTEVGGLDDEHRGVDWEGEQEFDDAEEIECEIECGDCYEDADQWDIETEEVGDPEDSDDEWYVRCASCDHEVEFSWSHPDRGGRIWPCESSDFNPWKGWPEPRYREAWATRGWLRPRTEVAHAA